MSRINRAPVLPGDTIAAANLNTRFTDFVQPGGLNIANTRDGAFDLPQMKTTAFLGKKFAAANLGKIDLLHVAPVVVASYTGATNPTAHIVENGAGTPTVLSLGAAGWTLTSADVFRVYWDLSVKATYSGTPWTGGGAIGDFTIPPATQVSTSASVWLAWLEWDITSNALGTWAAVPGQSRFSTNYTGARYGDRLTSTNATTVIPIWIQRADAGKDGALNVGSRVTNSFGWKGVSGTYYYLPGGNVTVYGLRVVVAGIAHPHHTAGANYLTWDPNQGGAGQTLEYTSGAISAIQHTLG